MKRFAKIFVAGLLILTIGGSMIACAPNNMGDSNIETGDKPTITMWLQPTETYDIEWWRTYVNQYNKLEDREYAVMINWVDGGVWDERLAAAQKNGTAPDLVAYPISGAAQKATDGLVAPLNDYVDIEKLTEDLVPVVAENITAKDGMVYGVPKYLEPSALLFYNKDMIEEAGLEEPNGSEMTIDDLIEYAEALTVGAGSRVDRYGLQIASTQDEYAWVSWALQYQVADHESLNDDWSAADLTGYESVAEAWKKLHDSTGVAQQTLTDGGYSDDYAAIFNEACAMQMCGSWIYGTLVNEYPDMKDSIGFTTFPFLDEKENDVFATFGGWSLCIDAGSKNKEAAGDFIEWIYCGDPEILVDYFEAGEYCKISPRISVNNLLQESEGGQQSELFTLLNTMLPSSKCEPVYPWQVSLYIGQAYQRVVLGEQSAAESLAQASGEINKYLSDNNLTGKNFN